MNRVPCSGGVWAPCLSYHDGVFYLIYTNAKAVDGWGFKDTHNYLVRATDILIPSFSLYLIHMLDEHFWHFGDRELICRYVPTMTGVLDWFLRKLTPEGLVGPTSQAYWPYFDWCKDCELGTPPAHAKGPLTLLSQLYASELHTVARIYEAVGWKDASREANAVNEALLRLYGDRNADCSRTDPRWRILAKTRRYGASSAAQYREKML